MLVAPAGYGKTTLAAQWAERERRPCAWLTADESDDDAAVLLARLAEALDGIRPGDAPPVTPARRPRDWSNELPRLASRLSTLRDFMLVEATHRAADLNAVEHALHGEETLR